MSASNSNPQVIKTVDISGFTPEDAPQGCPPPREPGGYEWGCQIIKARALKWLKENGIERELPTFVSFTQVYGLCWPVNKPAEELEKYALDHSGLREFGATGAMVQASLVHAWMQFKLGDAAYLAEFEADRIFDFDIAQAFEPDTSEAE